MPPEQFKQVLSQLTQTGLSFQDLRNVISLAGDLDEEEMNFPTRWETTDMDMSAEGNMGLMRAPDLSSVLSALSYYD